MAFLPLAAGCGGGSAPARPPEPAAPDPNQCIIPTGDPGHPRELIVAARGPQDSVVLGRQPQPLIRFDCLGAARPAAAESWTPDESRHSWTLALAPSSRHVTAGAIAAEWRSRADAATTLRQAGVSGVAPLDDRRLIVTLDWASDSVPAFLADGSLSVVTDTLPALGPTLQFRAPASGDLRDALDGGADVLRTGDPELAEYARTRGEYVVHPLPWTKTYLLIIPPRSDRIGPLVLGDSAGFRASLARDAVQADARGAEPASWWNTPRDCPALEPAYEAGPLAGNAVLYAEGDAVAKALAERLVAISDDSNLRAIRITSRQMALGLRSGSAGGFVVAVPRTPLVPCRETTRWARGSRIYPLIDTRGSAIVRRGGPRLAVDLDGALRLADTP